MFQNSLLVTTRIGLMVSTFSLASTPVDAALVINLQEIGSDVVATGSGTANLTGLTFQFPAGGTAIIHPSIANIAIGGPNGVEWYSSITTPANFGSGGPSVPNTVTGLRWGVAGNSLVLPTGYLSGDSLSSTATWNNTTLAELGVTPGTYTWTWGSGVDEDSLTLNAVGASAIPEPSSLVFVGLACFGFATRARKKNLRKNQTMSFSEE